MIFCYRCVECSRGYEEEHRPGRAPQSVPCICQGTAVRDFGSENHAIAEADLKADRKYPYVSSRLPRNLEGCDCNDIGKPVILSRRHEREVAARFGYRRD